MNTEPYVHFISLFSAAYHRTEEVSFVYHDVAGFT